MSVAIFLLPSSHRRGALELEGVDADGLALQLESAGHAHACFLPPQLGGALYSTCAPTEPSDQTRRTR
jgi:hypothetical protein